MLVCSQSRICFGLEWYDSEEEALAVAKAARERGETYNGGWHHGELVGRVPAHDSVLPDGTKLYAVSRA